jgi:hypothetical protein
MFQKFEKKEFKKVQLISDAAAATFLKTCQCLVFEPTLITDQNCMAEYSMKYFCLLSKFYKKPVYALITKQKYSSHCYPTGLLGP